jgi:NodT family efflux transporter outer membrane factor (OMF) lipoprotein
MSISLLNKGLRAALAGVSAACLTSGCMAVGPNFHEPAPPTAGGYAMAGDDANPSTGLAASIGDKVVADWWTLFQSPALDQIMREAIANNRTLEQARARLAQAKDTAGTEGGQLTADAAGSIKRSRLNFGALSGGLFSINPEFNLYSASATVGYDLDLFGGAKRRRQSLAAQAEAEARALDAAYLDLTGQVVKQVLIVADAGAQADALQDIIEHDQTNLTMIRQSRAAGGASAVDVAMAESQLDEDSVALPAQRQRLAAARHRLAVLVGKSPSEWSPPTFDARSGVLPRILPTAIPSALVRSRPDILEAEAQLRAATAEIGVAEAARYPDITLNAGYNVDTLTPESFFSPASTGWVFGPALSAPLFHSGELKARQRAAEDAARGALAAYQQTVLEAFAQVADVLQAVAHDNQAYADQNRALQAAAGRLEATRDAYRLGGVSALQVVDAERGWRRARLSVTQLGTSRYADAAMLLLATANVPAGAAAGPAAR